MEMAGNGPEDMFRLLSLLTAGMGGGQAMPGLDLLSSLAQVNTLMRPSGLMRQDSEGPSIRGMMRIDTGQNSLIFLSVPGRGIVGAAVSPPGQDDDPFPLGLLAAASALGGGGARSFRQEEEDNNSRMGQVMEQVLRAVIERSIEEQRPAVPPATESVRDALPRVVVTKEDLLDATNSRCAVCLEEYKPGARATRIFCGHLFCTGCIREWLRSANSCPVCRWELATDNESYESGRRERMCNRVARLRAGELRMLRVPELRQLMRALGVPVDGCLEKADLFRKLEAAPNVEVAPDEHLGLPRPKSLLYQRKELGSLELPLLRSLMERHRVLLDCGEQDLSEDEERDLVLKGFETAGWLLPSERIQREAKKPDEAPPKVQEAGKQAEEQPTNVPKAVGKLGELPAEEPEVEKSEERLGKEEDQEQPAKESEVKEPEEPPPREPEAQAEATSKQAEPKPKAKTSARGSGKAPAEGDSAPSRGAAASSRANPRTTASPRSPESQSTPHRNGEPARTRTKGQSSSSGGGRSSGAPSVAAAPVPVRPSQPPTGATRPQVGRRSSASSSEAKPAEGSKT